jgi:hypothetical protein
MGNVEIKWTAIVVWSVPAVKPHWAWLVLGGVTSETDCIVGSLLKWGIIFCLKTARILCPWRMPVVFFIGETSFNCRT